MTWFDQSGFDIRCDWGLQAVMQFLPVCDAMVIVDVLSFTTCVSIAVENGAIVYPSGRKDATAQDYATEKGALLASVDRQSTGYTLSPASLLDIPAGTKLVLPSPNGSRLSAATGMVPTFAGCLRNAKAVAHAAQSTGQVIAVIAAGERWTTDMSLRPSLEDWIGAGAVIHHLHGKKSPDALAAEATYLQFKAQLPETLMQIGSGIELIEKGFPDDVRLAAQHNVSEVVPQRIHDAYQAR